MALLALKSIKLSGISACVPSNTVSNSNYEWLDESERKLLIKTVGVSEKRIAPPNVTTADLCFDAAEKLIADLEWNRAEIGALIFVSQSGDYLVPATGVILQNRLGL